MAYTVDAAFDEFYTKINLDGDKREIANKRRDSVVSLLENHFEIMEAFASGSIPKFTALKGADVDVIVALHWSKHVKDKTPKQVLQAVRDALGQYRPGARKNGQAVTLRYETWPNVDIVPVSRVVDNANNITHYQVPNENTGTWIKSNPKKHAAEIETRSSTCGANFRRIIKMVKAWNAAHSDYLQSYHIEILALNVFNSSLDDTSWQVYRFFDDARAYLKSPLWHDLGYVDDYLTANDRAEVLKRFDTAKETSVSAWHATYGSNNDHKTAIAKWKQVFGDQFPAYG
jgi:hypothetical protein